MFFERDVLVYEEQAKDRRRRREEERLFAVAKGKESETDVPSRPPRTVTAFRLLLQKLLPAR